MSKDPARQRMCPKCRAVVGSMNLSRREEYQHKTHEDG